MSTFQKPPGTQHGQEESQASLKEMQEAVQVSQQKAVKMWPVLESHLKKPSRGTITYIPPLLGNSKKSSTQKWLFFWDMLVPWYLNGRLYHIYPDGWFCQQKFKLVTEVAAIAASDRKISIPGIR